MLLPPLFPGLPTLYVSALVLGSTFHFFFITVQGIAGGIGGTEHRARNFALVGMGFSAAGFIGPFLAGLAIDHLGHLPAFLVLAVFPVVPMLMLLLKPGFLPKARKHAAPPGPRSAIDLWRMPALRKTFIASGIISSAWDLFQFYFPVYGHSVGLSASAIGAVLGVFALATFTIRVFLPALARRYSEAQILTGGIFVAAVAFALFPLFANPYVLAAVAFLLGLGRGLRTADVDVAHLRARAAGPGRRNARDCASRRTTSCICSFRCFFGSLGTAFGYAPCSCRTARMLVGGGRAHAQGANLR